MKLRNITPKAIPYIAVLTMAVGLMGCSGGDNADINRNTEITSTTEDVVGKGDSVDSTDNTASDNTGSDETTGNETTNSGGDSNNNSASNNSSSGNGSTSGGNSGSNNTGNTGNTGTGNNKKPSGNTSGSGSNGGTSSGNTGSSNSGSNTGSSGSNGSSSGGTSGGSSTGNSGSTGGSSGNSSGSSGGVTFVDYVQETTYEYSTSKVDSYTNKYTATEVTKTYERYSDGSKIELGEGYTSRVPVGEMVLTVKNTAEYTYVKLDSTGTQYMNDEQKSLFNKYHDKSFGGDNYCTYYQRKSDGARFVSEKVMLGDSAAKALVKELGLDNTSVTKERRLFLLLKWMDDNVTYYGRKNSGSYACLVDKKGICNDSALTICNVLNYTDIPALYVSSKNLNHAWNLVQLDDGCWYYIDSTPTIAGNLTATNIDTYGVQEINDWTHGLNNVEPYLKLGVKTNEAASDAVIYNYNINYCTTGDIYKGIIKYPDINNVHLNYQVVDVSTDKFPSGRVYIKGSDLTH